MRSLYYIIQQDIISTAPVCLEHVQCGSIVKQLHVHEYMTTENLTGNENASLCTTFIAVSESGYIFCVVAQKFVP